MREKLERKLAYTYMTTQYEGKLPLIIQLVCGQDEPMMVRMNDIKLVQFDDQLSNQTSELANISAKFQIETNLTEQT